MEAYRGFQEGNPNHAKRGVTRRGNVGSMHVCIRRHGAALISGAALAVCFPTYHLYGLVWIALVPLLARTLRCGPAESARQFFLAGGVFYLLLLQWLLSNVYWAGGWAIWGYLALCALMAGYWAGCGALWAWMRGRCVWLPQSFALAVVWVSMEWLQARLFTGFGWGALAYSQANDLPLLQLASVGGTGLIAFVVVLVNALVAAAVVEFPGGLVGAIRGSAIAVILGLTHLGGQYLLLDAPQYDPDPFQVGMYQSAYPLEMKWDPAYTFEMVDRAATYSEALATGGRQDLFVWPEALVMRDIGDPEIFARLQAMAACTNTPLFTGVFREDDETGNERNAGVLLDASGRVAGHYDKIHLAPFGEYVPLGRLLPFVSKVVPSIGEVEPGAEARLFDVGKRRFGPLICFETLFPEMAERLRRDGADFLVVITNLAWFGASNAIPEEIEIARLRCVETRLPMVHVSNTGVTGIIDPYGVLTPLACAKEGRLIQEGNRLAGALPLPKAAQSPLPGGPVFFPWIALALTFMFIGIAVCPRRAS